MTWQHKDTLFLDASHVIALFGINFLIFVHTHWGVRMLAYGQVLRTEITPIELAQVILGKELRRGSGITTLPKPLRYADVSLFCF